MHHDKGMEIAVLRGLSLRRREALEGYLWISPWLVGFIVFWAGPLVASLFLSFTQYSVLTPPEFIGLQNYVRAFTKDRLFWHSLRLTLSYAAVNVPLGIFASLLLAMLLNQKLRGTSLFRTLVFIPSLVPDVASALLWIWLFHPSLGVVNYFLSLLGIDGPSWFSSTTWVLPSFLIVAMWLSAGGAYMITFLAGLQDIPPELYEAAEIDGAGKWAKFWNVTLPMLSPVILFNMVLKVIGTLSAFSIIFVCTGGGPGYASWFYVLHIYSNAFRWVEMGYACTLAWIFFLILLAFTYLQVRWSRRWVYYSGGARP